MSADFHKHLCNNKSGASRSALNWPQHPASCWSRGGWGGWGDGGGRDGFRLNKGSTFIAYSCSGTVQRRGCKEQNGKTLKMQIGSGKGRLMRKTAVEAWRRQQRECRNPSMPNTGCVSEIYSSGFGSIFSECVYICLLPSVLHWV